MIEQLRADLPESPFDAAQHVESRVNGEVAAWRKANRMVPAWVPFSPEQAIAVMGLYMEVRLIQAADPALPMLAVYDPDDGLYVDCSADKHANPIVQFVRSLKASASVRWVNECMAVARATVPKVKVTTDPNLVALENGVFDMATGELRPYTPDLVFLAKARTKMPAAAPELPVIGNGDGTTWDPQSWLTSTMGSEELANAIMELVSWCLRPRAFGDDKVVVFHARSGSNGKGTVLQLLRTILGGPDGLCVRSIPLEHFGRDSGSFLLSPLVGAVANLCDESNGNAFMESSSTLKAVTSHDPVMLNRKNRDPIEVALYVPMIFSLNKLPRMKDQTGAVDRRLHIIPFGARFMSSGTAVAKNPRIKKDYIRRDDVREWFVWQALVGLGQFDELSTPPDVVAALDGFREENVGTVGFWAEYGPAFTESGLTFLPFQMLHAAHEEAARMSGSRGVEKLPTFIAQIIAEAEKDGWSVETTGEGSAARSKRYRNRWGTRDASIVTPIISSLGSSMVEHREHNHDNVEYVRGSRSVARWTYDRHVEIVHHRVTTDVPVALAGLVRESAPTPEPAGRFRTASRGLPSSL